MRLFALECTNGEFTAPLRTGMYHLRRVRRDPFDTDRISSFSWFSEPQLMQFLAHHLTTEDPRHRGTFCRGGNYNEHHRILPRDEMLTLWLFDHPWNVTADDTGKCNCPWGSVTTRTMVHW